MGSDGSRPSLPWAMSKGLSGLAEAPSEARGKLDSSPSEPQPGLTTTVPEVPATNAGPTQAPRFSTDFFRLCDEQP